MKNMLNTATGIRKYGFTTAAKIIEPIMLKMFCVESSIDLGKISSTAPMSFEKRLSIRPDGFISKNLIDDDMIPLNIELCMFREMRTQIS